MAVDRIEPLFRVVIIKDAFRLCGQTVTHSRSHSRAPQETLSHTSPIGEKRTPSSSRSPKRRRKDLLIKGFRKQIHAHEQCQLEFFMQDCYHDLGVLPEANTTMLVLPCTRKLLKEVGSAPSQLSETTDALDAWRSMNDLAHQLRWMIAAGGGLGRCAIDVINQQLNRIPMGAIKPHVAGKPRGMSRTAGGIDRQKRRAFAVGLSAPTSHQASP